MTTLYLLVLFGICRTDSLDNYSGRRWSCIGNPPAEVSYAFGVSADYAFGVVKDIKPGTYRLYAGQCQAETRQMSNLCVGSCPMTTAACSFHEVSVASRTVVVTEFVAGQ